MAWGHAKLYHMAVVDVLSLEGRASPSGTAYLDGLARRMVQHGNSSGGHSDSWGCTREVHGHREALKVVHNFRRLRACHIASQVPLPLLGSKTFGRGVMVDRGRRGRSRGGRGSRDGGFQDGAECSMRCPPFGQSSFD
eukprot:scaffold27158_cov18-Tisochrysis_lutea.AAC.1